MSSELTQTPAKPLSNYDKYVAELEERVQAMVLLGSEELAQRAIQPNIPTKDLLAIVDQGVRLLNSVKKPEQANIGTGFSLTIALPEGMEGFGQTIKITATADAPQDDGAIDVSFTSEGDMDDVVDIEAEYDLPAPPEFLADAYKALDFAQMEHELGQELELSDV